MSKVPRTCRFCTGCSTDRTKSTRQGKRSGVKIVAARFVDVAEQHCSGALTVAWVPRALTVDAGSICTTWRRNLESGSSFAFQTEVVSARFVESQPRSQCVPQWALDLGQAAPRQVWPHDPALGLGRTKSPSLRAHVTCNYLVLAIGPLSTPKLPAVRGLGVFKGRLVHSANWDWSLEDLRGQTVGIVGTGATAVQVVPELAPVVHKLVVFQRTPCWCAARHNRAYTHAEAEVCTAVAKKACGWAGVPVLHFAPCMCPPGNEA